MHSATIDMHSAIVAIAVSPSKGAGTALACDGPACGLMRDVARIYKNSYNNLSFEQVLEDLVFSVRLITSGESGEDFEGLAKPVLVSKFESKAAEVLARHDAFVEEREELKAQVAAGVLDVGLDSGDDECTFDGDKDRSGFRLSLASRGRCFRYACDELGIAVGEGVRSVSDLNDLQISKAREVTGYKVFAKIYGRDHEKNHMVLVSAKATNFRTVIDCSSGPEAVEQEHVMLVTSFEHFFNRSNEHARVLFYAEKDPEEFGSRLDEGDRRQFSGSGFGSVEEQRADRGEFGSNFGGPAGHRPTGSVGASAAPGVSSHVNRRPPPSVVDEEALSGASNVNGGVVRSRRRVISPKSQGALSGQVSKNYRTVAAVMFNNSDEMYQDKISRPYAQEIIEELFESWGVPMDQPKALKYAEDLLVLFMITVTASNKADYNRSFQIPVEPVRRDGQMIGEIDVSFSTLSAILEAGHGKTRRQFARAMADDQREFLRQEENTFLLPQLATRIGGETQLAYLAFDGSTHCNNMTSREVSFTKTLEARNLFERDDVVATGASDRLMAGFSGGVRSVAPR